MGVFMKSSTLPLKLHYSVLAVGFTLALYACGGGGGAGTASNSASPYQIASGVVTGFGSVFVDGVELQDANASVVSENYDGTLSNSVLQMGQRVRVSHDGKGAASSVTLDAAVIGTVSNINTNTIPNTLTVAGQKVAVVTDIAVGALTVWGGGYTGIASIVNNDLVEVHGTPLYDSASKTYTVTATRIAKVPASTGRAQVSGSISNLDAIAKTFALNGLTVSYTSASLRPNGATLANGTVVTVYAPVSALLGNTVTASHLKVNRLQDGTAPVSNVQIGGQVSKYDSTAKTFELQGIRVSIAAGTGITPLGKTISNGSYVKLGGTVNSDGSITATDIQVREQSTSSDLAKVNLIGVISDFIDSSSFVVRGVPVDASAIVLSQKCPSVTLANNVEVQVTATQQANTPVVLATDMSCRTLDSLVIRPVDGTASKVDATAKTFTLTLNNNVTQAVQWNSNTTFSGLTSSTLSNSVVRVEGYLSGATLVARTISSATNSEGSLDDAVFRKVSVEVNTANNAWANYRAQHPSKR
jgi:hypothetical protein